MGIIERVNENKRTKQLSIMLSKRKFDLSKSDTHKFIHIKDYEFMEEE